MGYVYLSGSLTPLRASQLTVLLQGFTLGYEAVDSLIVIDTPDAVKAFTTTSFSIDADVGMGVGKLAGQVHNFPIPLLQAPHPFTAWLMRSRCCHAMY